MKKFLFLMVVAPTMLVGCSMLTSAPKAPAKLTNTATYTPIKVTERCLAKQNLVLLHP